MLKEVDAVYTYQHEDTLPLSELQVREALAGIIRSVYAWMCLGLLVTAVVAAAFVYTPLFLVLLALLDVPLLFFGLLIAELVLVAVLTARIDRLSLATARFWFIAYAALNGLTFSIIFLVYTGTSIALTFVATGGLFGAMAIIGYTTRKDLTSWGSYLVMGLIGLIIASVVNMFLASSALGWLLTYGGIVLFLGLTIYDSQRIKKQAIMALGTGDQQAIGRLGLLGALRLYLDFINLFLLLLRLTGRRRR